MARSSLLTFRDVVAGVRVRDLLLQFHTERAVVTIQVSANCCLGEYWNEGERVPLLMRDKNEGNGAVGTRFSTITVRHAEDGAISNPFIIRIYAVTPPDTSL